jgi:glycerophosphoryl diester phosphodiesterase
MSQVPLILGHRGASAIAPENTLAAFSRAISDGADGIEFDVRLSRDGVPVVIHDANLKRTGLVDRAVAELTVRELQDISVGSWFDKSHPQTSFADERIPLLTDVFNLFRPNDGLLYVELKCTAAEGAALAAEVVRLTRESGMAKRVVVESFDHAAIASVKKFDIGIRTAALFEPSLSKPISLVGGSRMIETALEVGADEIALHHALARRRLVETARQRGLEVVVWTVDEAKWIARARELGVKALIANNPAAMLRHRTAQAH